MEITEEYSGFRSFLIVRAKLGERASGHSQRFTGCPPASKFLSGRAVARGAATVPEGSGRRRR